MIAGIVGTKIVRYDIFGSDQLIANKMESKGKKGFINVSEDTKRLIESDEKGEKLEYTPHVTVNIANGTLNKQVNTFLINTKKNE